MNAQLTGTARLAADPELSYTKTGKAVCEVRLAFSNSTKDRQSGEYKYSPPIWVSATLWETMAENAAALLRRGDEVIVAGVLEMEQFEKRDGTQGEKLVLKMAEVAPSVRRAPALIRTDDRGETQPRPRSDNRSRPAAQHRTPDPVGARSAGSFDDL